MIHLVLEHAGEQSASLELLLPAVAAEAVQNDVRGPDNRRVEAGHAQATFLFELHPVLLDDTGLITMTRSVALCPPEDRRRRSVGNTDLRCGQTDAGRGILRLDHVIDELVNVGRDLLDGFGRPVQGRLAVSEDGTDHDAVRKRRIWTLLYTKFLRRYPTRGASSCCRDR